MTTPPIDNSRRSLLFTALHLQDPGMFVGAYERADPVNQNVLLILREWAKYGAQSVQMPDTYAAALMMTDARAAITPETRLPWPAFEIILPQGLIHSATGPVQNVIVARRPPEVRTRGAAVQHEYFAMYTEAIASACHTFHTLENMVQPEDAPGFLGYHSAPEGRTYQPDIELRIWQCLGRVIGGVLLAIENARQERPASYPQAPAKVKHHKQRGAELRANTWQLGKPLKLDLRPQIREFISGKHGGGGVPSVRTMVRGHWKRQVHGPGRSLRKNVEIQPYFRGDGPALIRGTELRDRPPPAPQPPEPGDPEGGGT